MRRPIPTQGVPAPGAGPPIAPPMGGLKPMPGNAPAPMMPGNAMVGRPPVAPGGAPVGGAGAAPPSPMGAPGGPPPGAPPPGASPMGGPPGAGPSSPVPQAAAGLPPIASAGQPPSLGGAQGGYAKGGGVGDEKESKAPWRKHGW